LGCISRTQNIPNMCFEGYQTDRHREITIRKITKKIDEIYKKKPNRDKRSPLVIASWTAACRRYYLTP
jgi:hypothetical protein